MLRAVGRTSGTRGGPGALVTRQGGGRLSAPAACAASLRFMRWMSRWVTRAVLVRGVPELGGCPRTPGASSSRPLLLSAPMFRLQRGARGAGPWSGWMETGFRALRRGLPVRWCPGICVSGVLLLSERSVWDEGWLAWFGLPLCFLCALEGAGERPVVAEFCGASVGASVRPGSAPPLTTARIPTIPGRKTHFNS